MMSQRIVLDANILIRAVLGAKVGVLLKKYAPAIYFYAPTVAFQDADKYLPAILAKRGIGSSDIVNGLTVVRELVYEIPREVTEPLRNKALARIGHRDPDDWPIVATALALECPIWTEDKDFFGVGIATWTSRTVELYFRE